MERGSAGEHRGEKAVMGIEEGEKEGQMDKKEKGWRKKKEKKVKAHGSDEGTSIYSANMKQVDMLPEMAENPCSERAEDGIRNRDVKKDRKKKKKDKEHDTVDKKHMLDATDENVGSGHVGMNKSEGQNEGRRKEKKEKVKARGSDEGTSIHSGNMKQVDMFPKMAENPSSERAEGDIRNRDVKKDRKKKKKDKEHATVNKKHMLDATDENIGSGHVEMNKSEGENEGRRKEKKEKKVKAHGSDEGTSIHSCNMKQDDMFPEMAENPCLERAEGGIRNRDVKKDRKKKKEDKERDAVDKKHMLDATDENVGSGHVEMNKSKGENDSKSKKGKQKCQYDKAAPAGSQIVLGEDKKRKSSVTLEEGLDTSKMSEKGEGKKKRTMEGGNVGQERQNTLAGGDGKSDTKEQKKSNAKNGGGGRDKKKVSQRKDKGRRVSFTDDVEVFNIDGCDNEEGDRSVESRLVHGQRFTPEEDAKIMEAMVNYAEMKQLGEKGLEMIAACIKHPETRGCWAEIATSLPHRPVMAIYKRARILLHRSAERKWTQEEYKMIQRFVEQNGTNWKKLAMELGKSEIHVKDFWRRMKPKNLKKGIWTQDEYQNLFDLVNLDLRVKAHQKFDHGHRLIRDNISWEAISDKLTTRSHHECCLKWYRQLTSPLVKQGIWADTDDYLLVEALQRVDAVCAEDVDWDSLLDDRSGEVCRQRWNQMVRMMGGHREKPFIEQVEVLSRRYCPEMLDYRT